MSLAQNSPKRQEEYDMYGLDDLMHDDEYTDFGIVPEETTTEAPAPAHDESNDFVSSIHHPDFVNNGKNVWKTFKNWPGKTGEDRMNKEMPIGHALGAEWVGNTMNHFNGSLDLSNDEPTVGGKEGEENSFDRIMAGGASSHRNGFKGDPFGHVYGETCGITSDTPKDFRIVHGEVTTIEKFPWQVFLLICRMDKGCHYCGGTIISDQYVLTAGHCLTYKYDAQGRPIKLRAIRVYTGMADLPIGFVRNARDYPFYPGIEHIYHRDFDSKFYFDVGLIKTKTPMRMNENTFPACLPKHDMCFDRYVKMEISGWGNTHEGADKRTDTLQFTEVEVEPFKTCAWKLANKFKYPQKVYVNEDEICAGGKPVKGPDGIEIFPDSCQGDSGGPMVFRDANGIGTITGVISWGIGCARPGFPAVYQRVTNYLTWIYFHSGVYMRDEDANMLARIREKSGKQQVPYIGKRCLDNKIVPGFSDMSQYQKAEEEVATCENCPHDKDFIIRTRDEISGKKFCLGRSMRLQTKPFESQRDPFMSVWRNCKPEEINQQWKYISETGEIVSVGSTSKRWCMTSSKRGVIYEECLDLEDYQKHTQKWVYNAETGHIALASKPEEFLSFNVKENSYNMLVYLTRAGEVKSEAPKTITYFDDQFFHTNQEGKKLCLRAYNKRDYSSDRFDMSNRGKNHHAVGFGSCDSQMSNWHHAANRMIMSPNKKFCMFQNNKNGIDVVLCSHSRSKNKIIRKRYPVQKFKFEMKDDKFWQVVNGKMNANCLNVNAEARNAYITDASFQRCVDDFVTYDTFGTVA